MLIASSAPAQNLFVSVQYSSDIDEFTPGGAQSTFASGLFGPDGLAFNSAGDLFVADYLYGDPYPYYSHIYEFTTGRSAKHLCLRVGYPRTGL